MENLDIFGSGLLDTNAANITIAVLFKWKLKDEIEPEILQEALNKTLEQFPYFKKTLINNNGLPVYVDNPYPLFIRKNDQNENVGSFINNYHLIQVTYEGNVINVYVSHNLTDGFGMKLLNEVLITNYVNLKYDCNYPLPNDYSEGFDPFLKHFDVSEDFEFKNYCLEDHFVFPEPSTKDTYDFLELEYSSLKEVCNKYNISPTGLLAFMVLRAVHSSYPENTNVITTRIPVDIRKILNFETLKNASNPQIILNLKPEEYDFDKTSDVLSRLNKDIKDQIEYDRIAYSNNVCNNLIFGREANLEFFKVFKEDITVSNYGDMLPNGAADYVDWLHIETKLDPSLKLYVFMYRLGNKAFIGMMNYIESDKLWTNLKKELAKFGLYGENSI